MGNAIFVFSSLIDEKKLKTVKGLVCACVKSITSTTKATSPPWLPQPPNPNSPAAGNSPPPMSSSAAAAAGASPTNLPPISSISPSAIAFLNSHFRSDQALSLADSTRLVSDLDSQCDELNRSLADLCRRLKVALGSYDSFSDRVGVAFDGVDKKLRDLGSNSSLARVADGGEVEGGVMEELPALAKEVARVEAVRVYAETALKLDTLIGEVEDAVSSVMTRNLSRRPVADKSQDLRLRAIDTLKQIEGILTLVVKVHPQWTRLVSAVDGRVDHGLAILRPQAIADHRALLVSLGWPPPLSSLSSSKSEQGRPSEIRNPLFTMHGELKQKYCENFIALCRLQELQRQRKSRQLEGHNHDIALHRPLWAIEELANPVSIASHEHCMKWINKPELIFALVYKITKDYVDSMDELLQPLIDEARLTGYSCREEWISAMVTSLSTFLAKEVFTSYVSQLEEENATEIPSVARTSWLNLVDLMIGFDKRIRPLAVYSEILDEFHAEGNLIRVSSMSVFNDRPDWLDIWAEIERGDILDKLNPEFEDEDNWSITADLSGSEHFKSPAISSMVLRRISSVMDRCRALPTVAASSKFARLVGAPIIQRFLESLLTKCLEAEALTALADDNALMKVIRSINSARHFKSILKEWSEDVFFLEVELAQADPLWASVREENPSLQNVEGEGNGIFDMEIRTLEDFRKEWLDKITAVVLRGFDAESRDFLKSRKQWQEKLGDASAVTPSFLGALDLLQQKMLLLEESLNSIDFAAAWRNLAAGIDRSIFNGIFLGNVKFSDDGVERFSTDMSVLFGLFRTWCLRPEGFFPCVSECLKLLKMEESQSKGLFNQGEEWMKGNGIRHLNITEASKVVRSRVF
ncbi:RINT1-like protein [Drosera capensis]